MELFLLYCYNDRLEAAELGPTAVCACMKVATYYGAPYLVHLCELGLAAYLDQSSKRSSAFKGLTTSRPYMSARDQTLPLSPGN